MTLELADQEKLKEKINGLKDSFDSRSFADIMSSDQTITMRDSGSSVMFKEGASNLNVSSARPSDTITTTTTTTTRQASSVHPLGHAESLESKLRRLLPEKKKAMPRDAADTDAGASKKTLHFFGAPLFRSESTPEVVVEKKESPLQKIRGKLSATMDKWRKKKAKTKVCDFFLEVRMHVFVILVLMYKCMCL